MMVCRNRETNQQTRPEVAMVPMPMTASTDTNYVIDDAPRKTNPVTTTTTTSSSQAAKANDYSKFQQPSAPAAGAVGGIDDGNMEYEQFDMYQALEDDQGSSPEDPCEYEVIEPKRPHPKPPKPY